MVLDDLMTEADNKVSKLFTKKSHHYDISEVYCAKCIYQERRN